MITDRGNNHRAVSNLGARARCRALGRAAFPACAVAMAVGAISDAHADAVSMGSLKALSIEELMNLEVTSVSKAGESLIDAPAAVYVITREDILSSGAKSIPDTLRLAPNLQVAQITSSTFAITARGFNGPAASKLLVLIDGRSVYTPYHSGVSWDVQDVLPEDIERIEVISGPGATLWGANAMNGVINITTRRSAETPGVSVMAGAGNLDRRGSIQLGGRVDSALTYRAYVDSFSDGHNLAATGTSADDAWHKTQGGFRLDWMPAHDLLTLQGDFYQGSEHKLNSPDQAVTGHNVLARWNHAIGDGSALQVQGYYDYSKFSIPGVGFDELATWDLDVQHSFSWGSRHNLVWGGGFRVARDDFPTILSSTQLLLFSPQRRSLNYGNIFLQDTIAIGAAVKLTLGAKYERDAYTGGEPLPNVRLSWKSSDHSLLWVAISRAVRAPSRLDRDLYEVAGPVIYIKGGDFQDERLNAYELGYRAQPTARSLLSLSGFYNVYTDLRTAEYSPGPALPAMFANLMAGHTYGLEFWGNYQLAEWWRLGAGANWLHERLHFEPGSSGIAGLAIAGNDPSYQVSLRSNLTLSPAWQISLGLRQIGALANPVSPRYTELDAHVAWTASQSVSLALTGSNLMHPHHLEFGTTAAPLQLGATGVETGRRVFLELQCKF